VRSTNQRNRSSLTFDERGPAVANETTFGETSRLRRLDANPVPDSVTEIRLFAKIRNEAERLPFFLNYYRKLGVNRFFLIDNCSEDPTVEFLRQNDDCHIFSTDQKMAVSRAGMDWIEPLLAQYGKDRWCLIVDADELLVYANCEELPLAQLCRKLDARNENALPCVMLDMYPKGNIESIAYHATQSFIEASPYFDRSGYRILPSDMNMPRIVGGPRMRIFYPKLLDRSIVARTRRRVIHYVSQLTKDRKLPVLGKLKPHPGPPLLNKVPLVRWNENLSFAPAAHFLRGRDARLSSARGALLHFKFLGGFDRRVKEEISRRAYFWGGEEYRQYFDRIRRGDEIDFTCELSTRYNGSGQLLELGLIKDLEHES
jgi:hypothetical protein